MTPGAKLGPYEILGPLGAGGMGEVYKARDTRLDRTVAIKVLPARLSDSPELRQRFEREARAISSLQHPNICVLHDVGQQEGVDYLVMEYLEGETLAARLQKGPLPLEQALKVAMEIADALETAHRHHLVHRDLKPGNVMLTRGGAKLMDFGLVKPATSALGALAASAAPVTPSTPTLSLAALTSPAAPLTQQGTLLGTFQYMAPEVLQGKEADARSDIFSFGCLLYEMLTGERAFEGKSQISVLAAILEKEPKPITRPNASLPLQLEPLVRACLAKNPEERWQTARDLKLELGWMMAAPAAGAAAAPRTRAWWLGAAAVLAIAILLSAGLAWYAARQSAAPRPLTRSSIAAPEKTTFAFSGDFGGPPELSPDGRYVTFAAQNSQGEKTLWLRPLDSTAAHPLDGTAGASFPFWSPDGRYLGFFAGGKLNKIALNGGAVVPIADAPNARGGSWSKDNQIVFAPEFRGALSQVSAEGGPVTAATRLDASKHTTHRWPFFLPDGRHFLYLATNHSGGRADQNGIYFASLDGKENKLVLASDAAGIYAAGYLLFRQGPVLMAQPFDPARGLLSGEPRVAAEGVAYSAGVWRFLATASSSGILLYQPGTSAGGSQLVWYDRGGRQMGKIGELDKYADPDLSPDGRRLAVAIGDPNQALYVIDVERGIKTRLTFDQSEYKANPAWSPDGKLLAYETLSSGAALGISIAQKPANGAGEEQVILPGNSDVGFANPEWSPDGRFLLFIRATGPTGHEIWAMPLTGDRKPFRVLAPASPQANVNQFRLSPDGRWIVYSCNESGQEQIYVAPFPGPGGKWQISDVTADFPAWGPASKEIFYLAGDGNLRSVAVSSQGDELNIGATKVLFPITTSSGAGHLYNVSRDGQRFLVNTTPEGSSAPLVLVTNWTAQLRK